MSRPRTSRRARRGRGFHARAAHGAAWLAGSLWLLAGPAAASGGGLLPGPSGGAQADETAQSTPADGGAEDESDDAAPFVGPPDPPWMVGPPAPAVEELVEGLYVATGYGGNRVARVTEEGVVTAGELTAADEAFAARLAEVTGQPVRYVLRTQRRGAEPAVLPAAWRDARLVAPEPSESVSGGAAARDPAPPPDLSFTGGLSVFLGETEIRFHHFGPAHTGGDAVALFPDLGVLYAGGLVVRGTPFIDYAAGGSSRGWAAALDGLLALEFETVVPGAGPVMTRSEAQVFRDRFVTLRMRAMQLLYRGVPREDALALLHTADIEWPLAPAGPFAVRSFAALYDELAAERAEARAAAAAEPDAADEADGRP